MYWLQAVKFNASLACWVYFPFNVYFLFFVRWDFFSSISQLWIYCVWTFAIRGSGIHHFTGFLTWASSCYLCHLISLLRSGTDEGQFFSTLAFILSILPCPVWTDDLKMAGSRSPMCDLAMNTTNHLASKLCCSQPSCNWDHLLPNHQYCLIV